MNIQVKRIYDPAEPDDGFRVLIDRLWPRGMSKQRAQIDLWAKEVAPDTALRTGLHHGTMSWPEFEAAYRAQLADNPALPALIRQLSGHPVVTLLYATADTAHNHAGILRDALTQSH